jgi:prepilin peptidase CpaA
MQNDFLIPVLAIAAAACITDVTTRRIPNVLTFGAAAGALLVRGLLFGMSGVFEASGGWVTGFILLFPLFFVRGLGGGDVKLVAALGAWLGPVDALWLALYTAVAGGLVGVGYAFARGYLRTALSNLGVIGNHWMYSGFQPVPGITLDNPERPRLPYAIPIFIGTMVTLWLR